MTRKRHIVIVDDEPNIGRSLRLILEGEGYRVSVFESAAAFRRPSGTARPPICTCSTCGCPDGSGIDLLRLVRQWDERTAGRDDLRPRHGRRRRRGDEDAARSTSSRSRSAATACCSPSRTRSSGRTCSARTSATASSSATRRG